MRREASVQGNLLMSTLDSNDPHQEATVLRNILAAMAGYAALVIVVMAGIGSAWAILGGTGAFAGEGPEPSATWLAFNIGFGFVAALVGGLVARKIGGSLTAVHTLIALILVLGVVTAYAAESQYAKRERIDKPVAEMSFMEAGQHAKQPAWYNWIIPLVGVAGAWVGGQERQK